MKTKTLWQRILKAAPVTGFLLLLPIGVLALKEEAVTPSLWNVVSSQDVREDQKMQPDEQRSVEDAHEPTSACGTAPEGDRHVQNIHQTVSAGRLIHKVPPKYPKGARKAHIEGTVVLSAEIGKDGRIANLRAVSGPKDLIPPSMEAVQQWVYKPYLLDGEPVDVETDIRVIFKVDPKH